MKVFLCGGGDGAQTIEANKRLNEVIDHSKPCLYIPLAMEQALYEDCYMWITEELKDVEIPGIEMVRSTDELSTKEFNAYSAIFIGGGNTFKLLNDLKTCGAFEKLKRYLNNGGVVFGGSAGAIIFGKDLDACRLDDVNTVNLRDTNGFDILNGISLLCHYTNGTVDKTEQSKQFLLEVSKHGKIIALPEEVTLFVNDSSIEVIGTKPYFLFEDGVIIEKNNGTAFA